MLLTINTITLKQEENEIIISKLVVHFELQHFGQILHFRNHI